MRSIFGFLILFLTSATALAAPGMDTLPYTITHYTDENGLPQNSVKFIAPDDEGFLWLATESGLVRFEGDRFRNFNNSSRISYIYPNAARTGLLARTDRYEVIRITNGRTLRELKKPIIADGYEYFVYLDTLSIYPATGLPNLYADVLKPEYYQITIGPHTYYMVGKDSISFTKKGVAQYQFKFPQLDPWRFFTIGDSLLYLTEKGGVNFYKKDRVIPVEVRGDILMQPSYALRKKDIRLFWNYVTEQLFFYLDEQCYLVYTLPDGSLCTKLVVTDFDFVQHSILSVHYDAANNRVYLGSRSKGLFVIAWKQFRPLRTGNGEKDVYYGQAPLGEHGIITPQGVQFNDQGKASINPLLPKLGGSFDNYSIQADPQGDLWLKTTNNIYKLDPSGTTILWSRQFHDAVTQLYVDKEGRLWIGTARSGLYYLNTKDEKPVPLLFSASIKSISCMQKEGKDILWVGSRNGLFRLHLNKHKVDTIPGFENIYMRSLLIPANDELWITTYGFGIYLYRQNKIITLPLDKMKYLSITHCIVDDGMGYFWITTNKGLFKASRKDLLAYADFKQDFVYYSYYGKNKGFYTNEFNGGCQPCALKLTNGDISLPSLDGLVLFSPGTLKEELPSRKLFLDEVELDGKSLPLSDTISLPNRFLQFKLHFSTPYFGDNYNTQIFYSVEGEGNDVWLPVESNRIISFSAVPSGMYKLRVRKINGFGANNFTERTIVFTVELAWFQKTWFRLLVGGLLTLSAIAYMRWRITSIQYKNQLLELRVNDRTRELMQAMAFLQTSENKLRKQGLMQQRLIAAITHDIKTPMKFLMLLSNGKTAGGDKNSKAIHEALYRMYHLVENLIQYMKTNIKGDGVALEVVDLYDLLEEKAGIFRPIASAREVAINNHTERGTKVLVNRQLLAVVMHNLLDNAVKYTKEGAVTVETGLTGNEMCIRFMDTGIGMLPAMANWVNQYDATVLPPEVQVHNGIGLLIVIELLQLINGRLEVAPNGDAGTTVSVFLHVHNN